MILPSRMYSWINILCHSLSNYKNSFRTICLYPSDIPIIFRGGVSFMLTFFLKIIHLHVKFIQNCHLVVDIFSCEIQALSHDSCQTSPMHYGPKPCCVQVTIKFQTISAMTFEVQPMITRQFA